MPREMTVNIFKSTTNLKCLHSWAWDSRSTVLIWSIWGRWSPPLRIPNQQQLHKNVAESDLPRVLQGGCGSTHISQITANALNHPHHFDPMCVSWCDVLCKVQCLVATLPCGSFPGCYSKVKCNSLGWFYLQTVENSSLSDPCFHQGYQRTINISDLLKNPCTSAKEKQFPFSQLYIQGEGDYQKCRRNILKLFNKTNCPYSSCSFNGIYLPPLQGDFGVSLHILQLSITQNIRKAET